MRTNTIKPITSIIRPGKNMSHTLNYSNKCESILVSSVASSLWIPSGLRMLLFSLTGQNFFLYYKLMGAYSNPETKLQHYPIPAGKKKITIVTGANAGISYETAQVLAQAGYKVIMACRSESKAQKAIKKIQTKVKNCDIEFSSLDLSSLTSVREFANRCSEKDLPLDILINNAGIMALPEYNESVDRFEMQYQVNYLSPFLLTYLLTTKLKETPESKIINLFSIAHFGAGNCDFSQINEKSQYSSTENYCKSKAASYMSTISFQERLGLSGVQAFSVHPGVVATDLWKNTTAIKSLMSNVQLLLFKTPLQGALTTLRVALTPNSILTENLPSGYFADELPMSPHSYAQDPARQEALWPDTCQTLDLKTSL